MPGIFCLSNHLRRHVCVYFMIFIIQPSGNLWFQACNNAATSLNCQSYHNYPEVRTLSHTNQEIQIYDPMGSSVHVYSYIICMLCSNWRTKSSNTFLILMKWWQFHLVHCQKIWPVRDISERCHFLFYFFFLFTWIKERRNRKMDPLYFSKQVPSYTLSMIHLHVLNLMTFI